MKLPTNVCQNRKQEQAVEQTERLTTKQQNKNGSESYPPNSAASNSGSKDPVHPRYHRRAIREMGKCSSMGKQFQINTRGAQFGIGFRKLIPAVPRLELVMSLSISLSLLIFISLHLSLFNSSLVSFFFSFTLCSLLSFSLSTSLLFLFSPSLSVFLYGRCVVSVSV